MSNKPRFQAQDEVEKLSDWHSFKLLFPFLKEQWGGYVFAFSLMGLSSFLMVQGARILGRFIDDVIAPGHWDQMWPYIISFLGIEVGSIFTTWAGAYILANRGTASILSIRKKLFVHIHELPLRYYDKQPEGRTVTRLTHDVENIESFFSDSLGRIVGATLSFSFSITAMIITSWKLGLFLVASIIPAVWLTNYFKNITRGVMREMSKNNSACNADLSEYLRGIEVIRAFSLNHWIDGRYAATLKRYIDSILVANGFFAWSRPFVNFMTYLPVILLLFIGGKGVLSGWFTIGLLVTYIRYCENFAQPISMISREINTIQQAFTSLERVIHFLEEETEDDIFGEGKGVVKDLSGDINFKNLSMGYEKDQRVLHNIEFQINPGEKVGIVGRTGCGKTTIISLLARLYPFDEGDIVLDGEPIADWDRRALRSQIGFISQDVTVFNGTLRENLLVGLNFSDEIIMKACKKSRFSKVMQESNMTLDYELLEGGANLSIGERQLLAFTRVLISNPKILILDEATANIDEKYEAYLQEALMDGAQGRTVLIIAHRLNTLDICDKILSFDQGRLVSVKNVGDSA